jgi:hypothetical protein
MLAAERRIGRVVVAGRRMSRVVEAERRMSQVVEAAVVALEDLEIGNSAAVSRAAVVGSAVSRPP